jgi:hypothetical protein
MSRHQMSLPSGLLRFLFIPFGGTPSRSYVDLSPERLDIRFGYYEYVVPLANIATVEEAPARRWRRLGWRSDIRRSLELIGSHEGVVKISLIQPQAGRLLGIPLTVHEVQVSLEDAPGFIAEIEPMLRQHDADRGGGDADAS